MKRYLLLLGIILALTSLGSAQEHNNSINTAILTSTANYPDALISAAPANKLGLPVLLTEKDRLSDSARRTIQEMDIKNVVIVGGPAVVSDNVESEVNSMTNTTTRLWGMTQIGTSVKVSEYFWSEGSDEAVIVQYPQDENAYELLSAVKDEVQDEDEPILISKEGTLSASTLSEVERLGATEVEVYSTNAVNVTQDLQDIGVNEVELEEAEKEELEERVQNKTKAQLRAQKNLVIVAAGNFSHAISAPTSPNSGTYIVTNRNQIDDAVSLAGASQAEKVFVVGQPDMAQEIADRIEAETNVTVSRVSGRPDEVSAEIARERREDWAEAQEERYEAWEDRVRTAPGLKKAANRSLERASSFVDENSTEEAQELLVEAQEAYNEGDYFEARRKAMKAVSIERSSRYRSMNRTEISEEVRDEREDFHEAARELRETNTEFREKLREADSMEERMEIIQEYKEERREMARDRREDRRDRFEDAAEKGSEIKLNLEGKRLRMRAEYTAPTGGYTTSKSMDVSDNTVTFTFRLQSPSGPATQALTDYEAESRRELENGTYTVNSRIVVDGKTVNQFSREITVPGFVEDRSRIRNNDDSNETEEGTENETRTSETPE